MQPLKLAIFLNTSLAFEYCYVETKNRGVSGIKITYKMPIAVKKRLGICSQIQFLLKNAKYTISNRYTIASETKRAIETLICEEAG